MSRARGDYHKDRRHAASARHDRRQSNPLVIDDSNTGLAKLLKALGVKRYSDNVGRTSLHVSEARRLLTIYRKSYSDGNGQTCNLIRDAFRNFGFQDWLKRLDQAAERKKSTAPVSFKRIPRDILSGMSRADLSLRKRDRVIKTVLDSFGINFDPKDKKTKLDRSELTTLIKVYEKLFKSQKQEHRKEVDFLKDIFEFLGFDSVIARLEELEDRWSGKVTKLDEADNLLARTLTKFEITRYPRRMGTMGLGIGEAKALYGVLNKLMRNEDSDESDIRDVVWCLNDYGYDHDRKMCEKILADFGAVIEDFYE